MKQNLLTVSAPPFWHVGAGIARASYLTMAALVPAAAAGVLHYGIGALAVISLSVSVCMLTEVLMQKVLGQAVTIRDGTAALTGFLLAMLLPAGAPWWVVAVGAVSAIVVGKQIYGGLGSHPMNAVLVGWIMIRVSWALHMDPDVSLLDNIGLSGLSPLAAIRGGYVDEVNLHDLMMGKVVGSIGSAGLLVLIGGAVLALLRVIKWEVSIGFLVGAVAGFLLLGSRILPEGGSASVSPLILLFTGPVMLGAFFLATDAPSSPTRPLAMWIYGAGAGFLAVLIQVYGKFYDAGVPFGILLVSLTGPLLDKIRPKALGKE
jgi:Na+-translocating ferredoxin:NAD+ oxidoreductase subunit D